MIKKLLKMIGFAGKTMTDSVGKSMDFIDDTLEKEYITSTIDKAKALSGDAVQKAGEVYEKTKQQAQTIADDPRLAGVKEKAKELAEDFSEGVERAKDAIADKAEDLKDTPMLKSASEALEKTVQQVKDKADDVMDDILGIDEEE